MSELIQDYQLALALLQAGELVAIPTETVYGLAADASNLAAIEKIYALKNRPMSKHLALNIHPDWPIAQWCQNIPSYTSKLIQTFWPGPLTLILDLKPKQVLPILEGPKQSIALRCPNHPKTLELLKAFGHPLVAPSANPSHLLSASTAEQVVDYFKDSPLKVLDGGPCTLGIESTILKLIDDKLCLVLREGAISETSLETCLGFKPMKLQETAPSTKQALFYFKHIEELEHHLSQHPNLQFCLIARASTCKKFPQSIRNFEYNKHLEQIFYSLCHQALKHKPQAVFIEWPKDEPHPGLLAQVKKFAQPLMTPKQNPV
jgi:L-threonylcarbamoyladenylate synthase